MTLDVETRAQIEALMRERLEPYMALIRQTQGRTIDGDTATETLAERVTELELPEAYCHAIRTSTLATTSGVALNVTLNGESADTGTATAQHDNATNSDRLTCQWAGMYVVTGLVDFAPSGAGDRLMALTLNGATGLAEARGPAAAGGNNTSVGVTRAVRLIVGDYVNMQAMQNSGGALNISTSTFLNWVRVGA